MFQGVSLGFRDVLMVSGALREFQERLTGTQGVSEASFIRFIYFLELIP